MRNISFATMFVLMAWVPALHAADPIKVPWNQLCGYAVGNQLTLTMENGDTVFGYCMTISSDEITINKDRKIIKIARSALRRIQVDQSKKRHQLRALGRGMQHGLRDGSNMLFSPLAPIGIVTIPGTLAWGAVAAPFCIIGDLIHRDNALREIKVI